MAQLRSNDRGRHAAHREPARIGVAEAVEIDSGIEPRGVAGRREGTLLLGLRPRLPVPAQGAGTSGRYPTGWP